MRMLQFRPGRGAVMATLAATVALSLSDLGAEVSERVVPELRHAGVLAR